MNPSMDMNPKLSAWDDLWCISGVSNSARSAGQNGYRPDQVYNLASCTRARAQGQSSVGTSCSACLGPALHSVCSRCHKSRACVWIWWGYILHEMPYMLVLVHGTGLWAWSGWAQKPAYWVNLTGCCMKWTPQTGPLCYGKHLSCQVHAQHAASAIVMCPICGTWSWSETHKPNRTAPQARDSLQAISLLPLI